MLGCFFFMLEFATAISQNEKFPPSILLLVVGEIDHIYEYFMHNLSPRIYEDDSYQDPNDSRIPGFR